MPFLDETLADERISETVKLFNSPPSLVMPRHIGTNGSPDYTIEQKVMIGVLAHVDGTCPTAKALDIPRVAVEAFKLGKSGSNNDSQIVPEVKARVDNLVASFRDRIAGKACERVEKVLDTLDDERINAVSKAKDLASIASSLANVTAKLSPILQAKEESNNVHFHFFRPRQRNEDEYVIIDVDDNDRVRQIG